MLLVCTILYALPRTAVLGAILLTGFLGGAVASKVRIEDPLFSSVLFGVYVGILAWCGLYLRGPCDKILAEMAKFGPDVAVGAGGTYINLVHAEKKFGILQPSSADRLDIGIKLKGKESGGRFEAAGAWNAMVTHRVRIDSPQEIDAEVRPG